MRKAVEKLLERAIVHDVGETAAQTGLIAGIQLANGADPEQVAAASALGFATGTAARPVMRAGGAAVGRAAEKYSTVKQAPNAYNTVMQFIPGTRQSYSAMQNVLNNPKAPIGMKAFISAVEPVNTSRARAFYTKADGSSLGPLEGDFSVLARMFGDNVAQAAAQLIAAGVM